MWIVTNAQYHDNTATIETSLEYFNNMEEVLSRVYDEFTELFGDEPNLDDPEVVQLYEKLCSSKDTEELVYSMIEIINTSNYENGCSMEVEKAPEKVFCSGISCTEVINELREASSSETKKLEARERELKKELREIALKLNRPIRG